MKELRNENSVLKNPFLYQDLILPLHQFEMKKVRIPDWLYFLYYSSFCRIFKTKLEF